MKALLTQWIGGGQTKGDIMSATASRSQKMAGDNDRANASSFMGLMMGFLSMNEKPTPAADGEAAALSEANKGDKKSANGNSILGISNEITGKNNAKAAALKSAEVEGEGKIKTNLLSEAEDLKTGPDHQRAESGAAATSSKAIVSEGKGENKTNLLSETGNLNSPSDKKISKSVQPTSSFGKSVPEGEEKMLKGAGSDAAGNETLKRQTGSKEVDAKVKTAKIPADKIRQKPKTTGETVERKAVTGEKNNSAEKLDLLKHGAAKNNNVKPAAGSAQADSKTTPVLDKISEGSKGQAASKKTAASQLQAENIMKKASGDKNNIVNEGKKNPVLAADVTKKAHQKQAKKLRIKAGKGRAPETTPRRAAVQGSQSKSASVQNSALLLRKPAVTMKNPTPGNLLSSDLPGKIEVEAAPPLSREGGQATEKGFKEIHLNELKSTRLAEASGRKRFSRHLGDIGRQQSGKSRPTARQTTRWKQHRFVLKDGNAINIAARTADGALQLQLNAGNGELGKVLHQHLQDIRQHIQQELDIEVDLQLQDFSGQQSNQQNETGSSSQTPTENASNSGESSGTIASATSSGTERVRYFGFNNNEWTA